MEVGYDCICSGCGKKYTVLTGFGFLYPDSYRKAVMKIKNGSCGKALKSAFSGTAFPNVDASNRLFKCEKCGWWECAADMSLYEAKDPVEIKRIINENGGKTPLVIPDTAEFDRLYRLKTQYDHICRECGSKMKRYTAKDMRGGVVLRCPDCGTDNTLRDSMINWD